MKNEFLIRPNRVARIILCTMLILLLGSVEAKATIQEPEIIFYKGVATEIDIENLALPKSLMDALNKWSGKEPAKTSCWRGYNGYWSIVDNRLYLDSLSMSMRLPKDRMFSASNLPPFKSFKHRGRVFASWFSDTLTVFSSPEVADEAEVIVFSNGVVTSRKKVDYVFHDYRLLEQPPHFQDGDADFMHYIRKNIKFPTLNEGRTVGSRIVVRFVIEKDGTISNVEVLKSLGDKKFDQMVINILESMPKWTPGQKNGSPVRSMFTFPLSIKWQ